MVLGVAVIEILKWKGGAKRGTWEFAPTLDLRLHSGKVHFSRFSPIRIGETMSKPDSLRERGNALEDKFFADLDVQLLEELKAKQEREDTLAEFSRITCIKDESVLNSVIKLGITSQSIAALRVFPLVAVAWADGIVEEAEREKVMDLASIHLGNSDAPSYKLLRSWLEKRPTEDVMDAWLTYAKGLVEALSDQDAESLKKSLLTEVKEVASASGGLLGWGSISKGEHLTMNKIESALTKE
jgi:hypothetical protein